jgi:hypothetical protein
MIFGCKFLFDTQTLLEQCTYLGYFLLVAPREYVQHGPLLSINCFRLCPQSGARVRSHAVRRRLFIVLMTAAHISPNVLSLRNFLGNVHVLFLIIHSASFILIIHHIRASNYIFYLHDRFTLSFLRFFIAGQLPSVFRVRYMNIL